MIDTPSQIDLTLSLAGPDMFVATNCGTSYLLKVCVHLYRDTILVSHNCKSFIAVVILNYFIMHAAFCRSLVSDNSDT